MRGTRIAAALAVLFGLAGCATSYGEQNITGGYEEVDRGNGVWRIIFAGNGYTNYETVQTYWLYRAAEITLQKGYDGFEILRSSPLARADAPGFIPVLSEDPTMQHKPVFVGEIRMLKKPFTERRPKVFDAAALKAKLDPIVNKNALCSGNVCPHLHSYLMPDI